MKKKVRAFCFVALWVISLLALGSYYVFVSDRDSTYSEEENRTLTGFPEFSLESLFAGSFTQEFESWLLDHFPGRNQVISATNQLQGALSFATHEEYLQIAEGPEDLLDSEQDEESLDELLENLTATTEPETVETTAPTVITQPAETEATTEATEPPETFPKKPAATLEDYPQTLGVFIDRGDGEERIKGYSLKTVAAVTAVLNKYAKLLPEGGVVSFTVVPQSGVGNRFVNAAEKNSYFATWDDVVYGLGADNVFPVDTAEVLSEAIIKGEYVYFRTDMHWTPYGSYLVYREMVQQAGKTPCSYTEDFDLTVEDPFRGTYYRDNPAAYSGVKADTLDLLMPKFPLQWRRITGKDTYKHIDFLNFNAKKNDRYTVYLGGPAGPWTYAQSDNGETENCLVITDSFGLGYIPFLTTNYAQVHYYDPRYYNKAAVGYTVAEMIEKYEIRDIYVVVGDLHSFDSGFLTTDANQQLGLG